MNVFKLKLVVFWSIKGKFGQCPQGGFGAPKKPLQVFGGPLLAEGPLKHLLFTPYFKVNVVSLNTNSFEKFYCQLQMT